VEHHFAGDGHLCPFRIGHTKPMPEIGGVRLAI
jgi:hypothetical protein